MKKIILNVVTLILLGVQIKAIEQNASYQSTPTQTTPIDDATPYRGKIGKFKARRDKINHKIPTTSIAPKKNSIMKPVLIGVGSFVVGLFTGIYIYLHLFVRTINTFFGGILK